VFVGNGLEMSASLDSRKFITADFFDKQAITTFKKNRKPRPTTNPQQIEMRNA